MDTTIDEQRVELNKWIERLQYIYDLMEDHSRQYVIDSFLTELALDPVKGSIFRLHLESGHAIRFTLEMCIVEPA